MAENLRPPVAVRVVRPHQSEDELLEHELETIGKTSIVLVGAHPRPTGVILRFEVALAEGITLLRGEGRVLAHKENAFRGQPGLTLRFTRLDPRSKAIVDRATSLREARQAEASGASSRPSALPHGALADALTASTPPPPSVAPLSTGNGIGPLSTQADQETAVANERANAREKANEMARVNARRTGVRVPPSGRAPALTPPPLPVMTSEVSESLPTRDSGPPSRQAPLPMAELTDPSLLTAPSLTTPSKDELLARLRERSARLAPERVQAILAVRH